MEPVIRQKELSLVKDISADTAMVWGDASKLTQVISNLIDNSIKYTKTGTITVSMHKMQKEGVARIEIRDTGIGMDKGTLDKVFEKFTRGENAREVNSSGSGLGLFIVKTFVEAHKGRIWIESGGLGKGSVFIVEFPLLIQNQTQPTS
jgi:signal transduction histidine kinase